jgi:hypothetical protein
MTGKWSIAMREQREAPAPIATPTPSSRRTEIGVSEELARQNASGSRTVRSGESHLLGRWTGRVEDEIRLTMEFHADGTVVYSAVDPEGTHTFTAHFTADLASSPGKLDIKEIESPEVSGGSMLAIVEFTTPDRMRMNANFAEKGSRPNRPKRFGGETVEFTRVR